MLARGDGATRSRTRLALAATAVAVLAGGAPAAAAPKQSPNATARIAWAHLIADTRELTERQAPPEVERALLATAKRGQRAWRRNPCTARSALRTYLRQASKVRKARRLAKREVAAGTARGKLQADAATVDAALLQLPRARRCGGAKASGVAAAHATVLASNERTLKLHVALPAPRFVPHQAGGDDYVEMTMDGMGVGGDVGQPGLPALTSFFAIPEGADVHVAVSNVDGYTLDGVDLYPRQPSPVDQKPPTEPPPIDTFLEPPFKIDSKAYASNRSFPDAPANGGLVGDMRDLRVGGVDSAGGQYRPRSRRLEVFTSMDVTVDFRGDNKGTFGTTDLLSPWNHAFVDDYAGLVNLDAIRDRLRPVRYPRFCGEELLIVTSPELRPAAETLRAERQAQGYVTSVREVGSGPGQIGVANTDIQSFIRNELTSVTCTLHPSYVILLGNTAHVPTFLVPCSPGAGTAECNIASDLPYSLNGVGTDLFADVQLGRLPAPTLDSANALVAKLNTYATTNPAPPGDDFLNHAAVTSYFQPALICVLNEGASGAPNCDSESPGLNAHWEIDHSNTQDTRGFTITAERIRNAIAADGYTADRLYTTDDADVNPLTYWNGTPIPSHLRRPAFPWNASTTDFLNAYDDGRFVILHRDHGWPDGWSAPTLHSGHVPLFTNGTQTPVVFGIDCASAAFDDPAHPSFVELQLLRPDGGAIAGFGDTRVSPSFPNNHMALGYFDAMFPLTVPDYGGPETRRLGDIQIRGKQYMATQEGFEWHGAGETYVEHFLYHLLGDPTMQMWSAPPVRFDPNRFKGVIRHIRELKEPDPGDPPYFVHFEMAGEPLAGGTLVTLFRGNEAVGRGIVGGDGKVDIVPEVPFGDQDRITYSLQQDGALPAQGQAENPPAEPPPAEPVATQLSATCPDAVASHATATVGGKLEPGFAGAQVKVTFTPPPNGNGGPQTPVVRTATTDANGTWSATITPYDEAAEPVGPWKARAEFAGDSGHQASASQECTFTQRR